MSMAVLEQEACTRTIPMVPVHFDRSELGSPEDLRWQYWREIQAAHAKGLIPMPAEHSEFARTWYINNWLDVCARRGIKRSILLQTNSRVSRAWNWLVSVFTKVLSRKGNAGCLMNG